MARIEARIENGGYGIENGAEMRGGLGGGAVYIVGRILIDRKMEKARGYSRMVSAAAAHRHAAHFGQVRVLGRSHRTPSAIFGQGAQARAAPCVQSSILARPPARATGNAFMSTIPVSVLKSVAFVLCAITIHALARGIYLGCTGSLYGFIVASIAAVSIVSIMLFAKYWHERGVHAKPWGEILGTFILIVTPVTAWYAGWAVWPHVVASAIILVQPVLLLAFKHGLGDSGR